MEKHFLYSSDHELQAFRIKNRKLVEIQKFQVLSNGKTEFAKYLSRHPKISLYWLINTTQETYQTTTLPHIWGKDRHELMAHRMRRLFEGTSYTYGIVQGRNTEGRKDDQVLFMALNDPSFLQPWLDLIQAQKVPLIGIYSLPFLSQYLLKNLPQAPYTLLVTCTPHSDQAAGLRQSFFINQKLQFSRLIPLNISDIQECTEEILNQINTTQHYLENEQMLSESELLSVVILTDTPTCRVFKESFNEDSSALDIHVLDSRDLAVEMGIETDSDKVLYLRDFVAFQLSQRWFIKNHYASTTERRYFFYRIFRMTAYLTSILLLSGAATGSAIFLNKTAAIQKSGQEIFKDIKKRKIELAELQKEKPDNLPIENILFFRNIVDAGFHIKAQHISPLPALKKLSYLLKQHPDLFLEQLEWGIGNSQAEIFNPVDHKINRKSNNRGNRGNSKKVLDELKLDPSKNFIEGIRLTGKIHSKKNPFDGDYLKALRTFNKFIKKVRQQKYIWKVIVLSDPYNPAKTLQGGKTDSFDKADKASFIVDILIKHEFSYQ
jgi:hypothetical protein